MYFLILSLHCLYIIYANSITEDSASHITSTLLEAMIIKAIIFTDQSFVLHYKNYDVEAYIYTLMHSVNSIFKRSSLGFPLTIEWNSMIHLKTIPKSVNMTINADDYLKSFCAWQYTLFNENQLVPSYHVAIMLTKLDLCAQNYTPCNTLGMAEVGSICQNGRSCVIAEDTGLSTAFTIAHEIGHLLGMKHDTMEFCLRHNVNRIQKKQNNESKKLPYIMDSQLPQSLEADLIWSNCSYQELTGFIQKQNADCLKAKSENMSSSHPPKTIIEKDSMFLYFEPFTQYVTVIDTEAYEKNLSQHLIQHLKTVDGQEKKLSHIIKNVTLDSIDTPSIFLDVYRNFTILHFKPFDPVLQAKIATDFLGTQYNLDHQCQLNMGLRNTTYYPGIEDICRGTLWCKVNGKCISKIKMVEDGTYCGVNKWCYNKECIAVTQALRQLNDKTFQQIGNWGHWGPWTPCSKSCGIGLSKSTRACDNPIPTNDGTFCVGRKTRYKTCNLRDCKKENEYKEYNPNYQCQEYGCKVKGMCNSTWIFDYQTIMYGAPACHLNCKNIQSEYQSSVPNEEKLNESQSLISHPNITKNVSLEMIDSYAHNLRDGTLCNMGSARFEHIPQEIKSDVEYDGVCIEGRCHSIACDRRLESRAKKDNCLICDGRNKNCKKVENSVFLNTSQLENSFLENNASSYLSVATIPKNATQITIQEMSENANYLALAYVQNPEYMLNGNLTITWFGVHRVKSSSAVKAVVYNYTLTEKSQQEFISIVGPLEKDLIVYVLITQLNVSINISVTYYHKYVKSNISLNFNDPTNASYIWALTDWSPCNKKCSFENSNNNKWGGTQNKAYFCANSISGLKVSDKLCPQPKPKATLSRKCNNFTCLPFWWLGYWQPCFCRETTKDVNTTFPLYHSKNESSLYFSPTLQYRSVFCVKDPSLKDLIDHSVCSRYKQKPLVSRPCPCK